MLEATIGLNEVESGSEQVQDVSEEGEGPFSSSDLSFLRSLRISISESEDSSAA
jgi:hypothetical protein